MVTKGLDEIKPLYSVKDVAKLESLLSLIISLANANSYSRSTLGIKSFNGNRFSGKISVTKITTNLVANITEKIFNLPLKLK